MKNGCAESVEAPDIINLLTASTLPLVNPAAYSALETLQPV
jgi:hypothetical protein